MTMINDIWTQWVNIYGNDFIIGVFVAIILCVLAYCVIQFWVQ